MIVCLDTNVLIWGIRAFASPGQEQMLEDAKALVQKLDQENHRVIIPSPVIFEYLVGFDDRKRIKKVQDELSKRFEIVPFDSLAAYICADIWLEKNQGKTIAPELKEFGPKAFLKVDCQIVAIAKSRNAEIIYSHDSRKSLINFAEGHINVCNIPPAPLKQLTLQLPIDS
jgi:predicted nucleic acid-binding protein